MKNIVKMSLGIVLATAIVGCSNDRDLTVISSGFNFPGFTGAYIDANTSDVKGFIGTPNPNATPANYTVTGSLASCNIETEDKTGAIIDDQPASGITYSGDLRINCSSAGTGTYTGRVNMSINSGGLNYSGGTPVQITVV